MTLQIVVSVVNVKVWYDFYVFYDRFSVAGIDLTFAESVVLYGYV